jgi:hypothetical protein
LYLRRKVELTPLSRFTLEPDSSSHHRHQASTNSQPQSRPPYLRVVDVSACVKGLKIVSRWSGGMPMPVSARPRRRVISAADNCNTVLRRIALPSSHRL